MENKNATKYFAAAPQSLSRRIACKTHTRSEKPSSDDSTKEKTNAGKQCTNEKQKHCGKTSRCIRWYVVVFWRARLSLSLALSLPCAHSQTINFVPGCVFLSLVSAYNVLAFFSRARARSQFKRVRGSARVVYAYRCEEYMRIYSHLSAAFAASTYQRPALLCLFCCQRTCLSENLFRSN